MRRITFSIILLSFVSLGLVQCKKNSIVNKDVSQQSLNELKSKVSELESIFKKAEAEKAKNPTKKISEKIQYQILNKIKNISHFLFEQLKFVADKSDKIISKKFFITAVLIAAPAVSLYCKFFTPNWLSKITQYFSSEMTQGAATLTKDVLTGVAKGTREIVDEKFVKEIVDKSINSLGNVSDVVIDKATNKILSNPKTLAKIGILWFGFKAVTKYLEELISQGGSSTAESTISLISKGTNWTGKSISKVTSISIIGLQKVINISPIVTKKIFLSSIEALKGAPNTIKTFIKFLPILSLPRFPGGIIFVKA